jgi:hypothetical protein
MAFPDSLKTGADNVKINCQYQSPEAIIPANYRSMDYIVTMQCSAEGGKAKVLVSVEIPEFTQKYEQMLDLSRAETELVIHPPMLEDAAKSLNSSKDAQLIVSVKHMDTGDIVLQDSKPVKLFSRYDMQWQSADGTPYYENILAWVTPEAPEVVKLLRSAADSCKKISGGKLGSIVGYQEAVKGWSHENITLFQVAAIMHAMASTYKVQYINSSFSSTSPAMQRIATPAKVISSKSGLCIETAVTLASAIQSTRMHAVIILLPGHAKVAVETWNGSGEYYYIETTALDAARKALTNPQYWDNVIAYLTKDEWAKHLAEEGVVAIDCGLAEELHIKSIN